MKQATTLLFFVLISQLSSAQNVTIPDATFKAVLLNNSSINTNGDDQIQVSEAAAYTGEIDISRRQVRNLQGIEAFTQITKLTCRSTFLTRIDLSNNMALKELDCGSNGDLISLNVSNNAALEKLWCQFTGLENLDVSNKPALKELYCQSSNLISLNAANNPALETLICSGNKELTSLDVSNNEALTELNCSDGKLTSLDVSSNRALTILNCNINNLTSLDVSSNRALTELHCRNNRLVSLDVSSNRALTILSCRTNRLVSLDVSNNEALTELHCSNNRTLTSLNVKNGNNENIEVFDARNNSSLTCIFVDNATWSSENWSNIASISNFVETPKQCATSLGFAYIPDTNFKTVLLEDADINTNNDDEIQLSEAEAYTEDISVANKGIQDLIGIEAFANITDLNCSNNGLTNVDLSSNINLTTLNLSENTISNLDLPNSTNLISLTVFNNNLTNLDLSSYVNLKVIVCNNNRLTNLNIRNQNNRIILFFNATENSNLNCITVDNAEYSTTSWRNIDNTTTFSESTEECRVLSTGDDVTFGEVKIYPNPVTDALIIESNTTTIKKVEVYNLLGSKMLESKQSSISVSQLPKGIYILKIIGTENQQKNQRFVKL